MKTKSPSSAPAYRRALKNLNAAIVELKNTRNGSRGRPTREYVQLMDAVGSTVAGSMSSDLSAAFLRAAAARGMSRQVRRAIARA